MIYSELVTAVQQYCECYESKFVTNIPTFVKTAEQRIYNAVQLPVTRKGTTLAVSADAPNYSVYNVPTDFLAPFSLSIVTQVTTIKYLLQKDFEWLREAYPNDLDTGEPAYYALQQPTSDAPQQTAIRLGPVPDPQYLPSGSLVLNYYAKPVSIVDAGQTWLGDNFNSALLYGAIVEGYVFLKGQQDMIGVYEQKFEQQLALLKQLGDGKDRQDTYRTEQVRVTVQ